MLKDQKCHDRISDLRSKAEEALRELSPDTQDVSFLSLQYIRRLIHELQVHQLGLEIQKEELSRTQRELEMLRDKYSELYDFTPFGYFSLDQNGMILDANLIGADLLGMDKQSLIGKPFSLFVSDQQTFYSYWQELSSTDAKLHCEVRMNKKDGAQLLTRLESLAVRDSDGRFTGLRTAIFDITEQKKAVEAGQTAEATFNAMIEGFNGLVYSCSPDYEIEFVNERLIQRTGHNPIGEKCYQVLHGREDRCPWCVHEKVQSGETIRWVIQSPMDDHWYYVVNTPISHRDGKISKMAMIEDITDRKEAEHALKESEERFRAIFDNHHAVMLIIDPETGKIEDASPGACFFYGYSREDLQKKNISEINTLPPERVAEKLQMARFQHSKHFEFQHRLANGELRDVEVCSGPIVIGGKTLLFSVVNDVTQRKLAEEALRRSEERYRDIFDNAPISIMEQDFSGIHAHFEKLRASGIDNLRAHFEGHPEDVTLCASLPRKLKLNQETATLFEVTTKEDIPSDLTPFLDEESWNVARDALISLAEGKTRFEGEVGIMTLSGEKKIFSLRLSVSEGHEKTLDRVLISLTDITEQKRLEEKLERSISLLRSTLEATADGLLVVTKDKGIVSFNQRLLDMWHIPPDVVEARDATQAVTYGLAQVENAQAFIDNLRESCASAESPSFDVIEFRDGRVFECYSRPQDIGGRIVGRVLSFRDVTDRKNAEKALHESRQRLELALAGGEIGFWDRNLRTGDIILNQRWTEMFGYPLEGDKATHLGWASLIHPDDFDRVMKAVDGYRKGKITRSECEYRLQTKSGEWKWVLDRSQVVERGEDGKPLRIVGAYLDITDRKRSEEALKESEQRNRLLIEESPVGIVMIQQGKATYINPAALDIFGYERPDEVLERPVQDFVAPEDYGLLKKLQEDRWGGKPLPLSFEIKGLKSNGEILELALWPRVIDHFGEPTTLAFVADRTEAKNLRDQLLHSQKMEAIGTLAGGIAHDFNNLLTIILGYSDLMLSETDKEAHNYEDLEKVVHAARTAGDMIQSILAFSRRTESKPLPIDLNRVVEKLQQMLSRLIPRTIEVEVNLASDLPITNADPSQIEQILMNLAVNARDAMPAGGRLIIGTESVLLDDFYCRSHIGACEGPHVLLTVSDTGDGIDKASMDRIFEPFYTTKKPGEGTGLGLAMVYGIVKNHGGHIICESDVGSGTTFRIYLPAQQAKDKQGVRESVETSAMGDGTILLVDDEEFIRSLAQRLLEKWGYHVITADNGKEAVMIYEQRKGEISLVILDLIMPTMDGKECLDEILSIDRDAKVLLASGHTPDEATRGLLEGRAKGFVSKPYDTTQMLAAIRRILGNAQAQSKE
ncbi:MAG: PAS domain S-box protein [Desulfomonile tiedjei]|uniref:histidine kinase n=1 Tax=Desulfomonile tiedjei TaxID=2358 RepID=A0A9D6V3M3_9BACT|nr:PAS domain S-box protein [Desulfomonile tiedjei]